MGARVKMGWKVMAAIFVVVAVRGDDDVTQRVYFTPGYNTHEVPIIEKEKALNVEVSVNLRNILNVDEINQLISLESTLRMYWQDPRVTLKKKALNKTIEDYLTLKPDSIDKFWVPDLFIDKAKMLRSPTYLTPPASLRIYADSKLRYSRRINYDIACNMDFHFYPMDVQECEVRFESFGHTNKQLRFTWKNENMVDGNITLKQFLIDVEFRDTYKTDYYAQEYPGLIMRLRLSREIGYHIMQTYIPSVVFVILGWLSIFIPLESIPGRVGMGMTTLLTVTAMFGSVRNNVPKVSYISYLDIWMLVSILFIFSCILEFIIATIFVVRGKKKLAMKFERISRLGILGAYIAFCLIYWTFLLSKRHW